MIALLLTAVLWGSPAPSLWVCNPGHGPAPTPSNCERVHYVVAARMAPPLTILRLLSLL